MRRVVVVIAVLVLASCGVHNPTFQLGPDDLNPDQGLSILDGAHGGGNHHFYWLPPLVSAPEYAGVFADWMEPTVEVCRWDGQTCDSPPVATFTMTTGSGSDTIRVVPEDEHYVVNWHTRDYPVIDGDTYRVRVMVGGTELGFADVVFYANMSQAKKVDTGETINLIDGRTLPVKFRIEDGAAFMIGPDGGQIVTGDGAVVIDIPPGALAENTGISVTPAGDYVHDPRVIPGTVFDFGPDGTVFEEPVGLTIRYDPVLLPPGTAENTLVLAHLVDGEWTVVNGSAANPVDKTVSGMVSSFSLYSVFVGPPPTTLSAPLVFASDRNGNAALYQFDGANLEMIHEGGVPGAPDWLGNQVVFQSNESGDYDIWKIDVHAGTPAINLTNTPGTYEFGPVWSPGGTRIAYVTWTPGTTYDIWVMDADGSNQTPLITGPANDSAPAWSPDGTQIAFHSNRDGDSEIYAVNWDGTNLVKLTDNPGMDDGSPAWSPDGGQIAYARYLPGAEGEIWIMDADGSNPHGVTTVTDAQDYAPAWSPDGSQIAFERTQIPSGASDIWVVAPDGTGLAAVVVDPADDSGPAWRREIPNEITTSDIRITYTDDHWETTPRLASDAQGEYVVYTSRAAIPGGGYENGQICVQRLAADGNPDGPAIEVSDGTTDDTLNDASGNLVVYSSFLASGTQVGHVKVYDVATMNTQTVTQSTVTLFEARISGSVVVWVQADLDGFEIMYYDLAWSSGSPVRIAGPTPSASNVEIGERYIVWEEPDPSGSGAGNIVGFDAYLGVEHSVTANPDRDSRQASVSGRKVVWQDTDLLGNTTIELAVLPDRFDPLTLTTLVDNGELVYGPSVDGDLVAFPSEVGGKTDVFLARISDGRIFQLTDYTGDRWLVDVLGDKVTYTDSRNVSQEIYLSVVSLGPLF